MTSRLSRVLKLAGFVLIAGCGVSGDPNSSQLSSEPANPPGLTQVVGKAQFGSQCPLGFYAPPTEVPLELWTCPLGLDPVVLEEPLSPFVLQVDCKKKTMDIRGMDRAYPSTTWEIMPDGSFYFRVDGGKAKLREDGAGHKHCSVPLYANLWGKVDCEARDQAVISLETAWWLGTPQEEKAPEGNSTSATPAPHALSMALSMASASLPSLPSLPTAPFPTPSTGPGSLPSLPSSLPNTSTFPTASFPTFPSSPSFPSSNPGPGTGSVPSASPSPVPTHAPTEVAETPCQVPVGCFFHTSTQVNQCR